MKNIAVKFGIYSGITMGVLFAIYWLISAGGEDICTQFENGEIIGYATMILALLIIFPGVKRYRDEALNGSIGFGRALGVGMIITFISALIFVVFDTVYLLVNPDFFEVYLQCQVEDMRAAGQSETEIEAMKQQFEMMSGPMGIIFTEVLMLLTVGLIGFVISLIAAAILKRN